MSTGVRNAIVSVLQVIGSRLNTPLVLAKENLKGFGPTNDDQLTVGKRVTQLTIDLLLKVTSCAMAFKP